jgi:5'-deoxynucleotidase YfbR-like HD superfamily hydrolase
VQHDRRKQFVVCVWNREYPASLELRKIYEQLPDREAESHGLIRVADEEDEALYPAEYFIPIDVPRDVEEAIESAAELDAR